jgi:hypothetical protein
MQEISSKKTRTITIKLLKNLSKKLQNLPHEANHLGFELVIGFIGDQTQNFKTPSYFQFDKMSLSIYFIRCALMLLHDIGNSISDPAMECRATLHDPDRTSY